MNRGIAYHIAVMSTTISLLASGCATKEDLYEQGKFAHQALQYDAAIAKFQQALEKDPNYVEAMYGMGLAYMSKKEIEKAIDWLEKVIKLDPKNDLAEEARWALTQHFFRLGRAAQQQGNVEGAVEKFEKAASYECKKDNAAEQARNAVFEVKYKEWKPGFVKEQLDARLKAIDEWATKCAKDKECGQGRPPFQYFADAFRYFIEGVGHEPKDKEKMSQDDARVYTRQSAVNSYMERFCILVHLMGGQEVPEKCTVEKPPKLTEENEFWDGDDYVIQASTSVEDLVRTYYRLELEKKL
jgi:tetratricopeptide (TPR) repeat protein